MKLAIFITVHGRPSLLSNLLVQIQKQSEEHPSIVLQLYVFEDPSSVDMTAAKEILGAGGGIWIRSANHRGKNGYYLTINEVLRMARLESADVNILLQDDVYLSHRFLALVETLPTLTDAHGDSIPDVVFLHRDAYRQGENAVQWTHIRPVDLGCLERIGWVDCVALAFGKLFVTKIDPLRAGVQGTSSGVPAQLSQQCARKSLPMLRVKQSWVKHLGTRSVMHETDNEMMRGIRQTVDFIDDQPRTPGPPNDQSEPSATCLPFAQSEPFTGRPPVSSSEPDDHSQPHDASEPSTRSPPSIAGAPNDVSHPSIAGAPNDVSHPDNASAPNAVSRPIRESAPPSPSEPNPFQAFIPDLPLPPAPSVRRWSSPMSEKITGTGANPRVAVTWQPQGLGQAAFAEGLRAIGFRVEEWKDCVRHLDEGRPVLFHGWFPMLDDTGKRYPGQVVTVWHSGWTGVDLMGEGAALAAMLAGVQHGFYRALWLERRDVRPPRVKSLAPVWSPRAMEEGGVDSGPRTPDPGLRSGGRRVLLAMCPEQSGAAKNVLAAIMGSKLAAEIHLSKNLARGGRERLLSYLAEPGAMDLVNSPKIVLHEQKSRADAVKLARDADLVVYPSVVDTWSYFVMEAIYAGTPVVVSDAVAWAHLLSPWARSMCVVPATSSALLVDVVGRLLDDRPARARLVEEQADLMDRLSFDHARSAATTLGEAGFDVAVPTETGWLREHGRRSRKSIESVLAGGGHRAVGIEMVASTTLKKLVVCHSPHASNCGIAAYGRQLDVELAHLGVTPQPFTFCQPEELVRTAEPGSVLLVHAEPSFFTRSPYSFAQALQQVRDRAAKIVFCCHWFSPQFGEEWSSLVDALVTHRKYDGAEHLHNVVVLPLGCPVYAPTKDRGALRAQYGLPLDAVILTTIGFLTRWKRFPDVVEALLSLLQTSGGAGSEPGVRGPGSGVLPKVFLQMLTPASYQGDADRQIPEMLRVFSRYDSVPRFFSFDFRPDEELLERVALSDLGFVFHGQHTGSVSAAAKTFVSARTPLVATESTHASDLLGGAVRVPSFDPSAFAETVVKVAADSALLDRLRREAEAEYARLNMAATAERYLQLFRGLMA